MSTALEEAHITVQVSVEELLKAVDQLPTDQLEKFIEQVILLQARRRGPYVPHQEADLLLKIQEGLPETTQQRLDTLKSKNRAGTLTPEEHDEFLHLIAQVEGLNVQRVEALAELAQLRGVTLRAVMDSLGIHPPPYE